MAEAVNGADAPLLTVERVSHDYSGRPILQEVSFTMERGERVALMGPSGSGKSTLLNCLAGIERARSGTIILGGTSFGEASQDELTRVRREKVTMVFQFFHLLPTLTAAENVELPMQLLGVPRQERYRRARRLLEETGVAHRANARPTELSGGEMQRVAIARALAPEPALLLADEPTGSLDRSTGARVLQLLKELTSEHGTSMLMVTHDPETVHICERTLHLVDGKLEEAGRV